MRSIIFGMLISISTCLFIQNARLNAELKYAKQVQKMTPEEKKTLKAQNGFKKYYRPTLVADRGPAKDSRCPQHLPYYSYWGCTVTPIEQR